MGRRVSFSGLPRSAPRVGNFFCSTVNSHLDLDAKTMRRMKNTAEAYGIPYNNCHNQQNKTLTRCRMVKQFIQVTFMHKKIVLGLTCCLSFCNKQMILLKFALKKNCLQDEGFPKRRKRWPFIVNIWHSGKEVITIII
jgi:hypothetical protein